MFVVIHLMIEYFDWISIYSRERLRTFMFPTKVPTEEPPVTRRDYARVPHFKLPPRYEVVNRRARP